MTARRNLDYVEVTINGDLDWYRFPWLSLAFCVSMWLLVACIEGWL